MACLVNPDPAFWNGKRVLVTGHTGFKGSWLMLWLSALGALPFGFSLPPESDSCLGALVGLGRDGGESFGDIRDGAAVARRFANIAPDVVLHLAAQTLVRRSYAEPVMTVETNVMGTVHVLEAVRRTPPVRAIVVVTSDKCYENREWHWPYREDDAIGGHDPYSASKGCTELLTAAWRRSFLEVAEAPVAAASARAGNVIGGGDFAADRLLPDCVRAMTSGRPVEIRNPHATRPWQHVLEPLCGYLLLAERLWRDGAAVAEAWNFGPAAEDIQPVSYLLPRIVSLWGGGAAWTLAGGEHPHETGFLAVDASKARARLGWRPRLPLSGALAWTVEWYKRQLRGEAATGLVAEQIRRYEGLADTPP
jgi:CDP-glucose 4,6-dehydratase